MPRRPRPATRGSAPRRARAARRAPGTGDDNDTGDDDDTTRDDNDGTRRAAPTTGRPRRGQGAHRSAREPRRLQGADHGLKAIVKPGGKASVALKIDKFLAAVPRLRAQLIKPSPDGYGGGGAAKATERIRQPPGHPRLPAHQLPDQGPGRADAIQASGTVADADQLDPDWGCLVDFRAGAAAFGRRRVLRGRPRNDRRRLQGVRRRQGLLDDGAGLQGRLDTVATTRGVGTGQALFIQECKTAGRIVYAPAGEGRNAPFAGANADKAFSAQRPVTAFVGLARDATATTFADAIVKYQLQASYYPSGAMLACQVGEDVVRANWVP